MNVPSNNTTPECSVSIRDNTLQFGKKTEFLVGIGDHQFMVSFDTRSKTMIITDPKTGEKLNLQIKDKNTFGNSEDAYKKPSVIDKMLDIIDIKPHDFESSLDESTSTFIKEYPLNKDTFSGNSEFQIQNFMNGGLIYKIDIIISEAFATNPNKQHNIAVYGEDDSVLMPESWNDPNVSGCYSTSLNYIIGSSGIIRIKHDLGDMISGDGTVKFYYSKPSSMMY